MKPLDVFSVRDLRERTGELIRDAESGRLALVTKHGRPVFIAIPFDSLLVELGVHRAVALHLFAAQQVGLASAAKIARLDMEELIALLGRAGIDAVDYDTQDLEAELEEAG